MALHPSTPLHWLAAKPFTRQTLICLFSGLSIVALSTSVAFAGFTGDGSRPIAPSSTGTRAYNPPADSKPSGLTGSNGTRSLGSCSGESRGTLTALAPLSQIGQTVATHPTFSWYMPYAEPYTIELRLYHYDSKGELTPLGGAISPSNWQSKQGIMQYTLPLDQAGLTVGQTYLWQVTLICNESSRSKDQILETDLAVVDMPKALRSELAKASSSDHLQRARLFAKAGFWYDALAEALNTSQTPKNQPPKTPPFAITLLQDLMQLEPPGTPEKPSQQYTQLKQIVEIERQ